jgi:superfamily I DNA/RNA helicase
MSANPSPVKVAVAADFLTAFSKIPRKQQSKVLDFVNKFRMDPTLSGINYEKIQKAKDPSLRSVRIDQAYRGIVLKPETGNVYVLLWVDHHDDAYKWAENKLYSIHPETGGLQVINVETQEPPSAQESQPAAQDQDYLFAALSDADLLKAGVPEPLLPNVRQLKTIDDLDKVAQQFPEEAYEALFFLASGYSLEEVMRELGRAEPQVPVDQSDYATALDNPDSKRRFFVVENELELAAMLNAPLEKWRVFLHPTQRSLVERDWNGPVRVLGGAGTGKTVVAMHRAKWLAEKRYNTEKDRILFTTFTRNLAADIKSNLGKICSAETLRRIEVVNLDKWVTDFLKQNGYEYEIDYGNRTSPLWEKALELIPPKLSLPNSFYREEWVGIVQQQGIRSFAEYQVASRVGRGVRLSRKDRKLVWQVFEEYRLLLNERGLREPDDAMQDARMILQSKGNILSYRAIIVDEAQDMGMQAFGLIRQMIPDGDRQNDLFIVGDGHQRIYRRKVVLARAGIHVTGRSRKLRINYRTTEETRRWAVSLLEGVPADDLDGQKDDQKGYKSLLHGISPTVRNFPSFEEEINFIADYLDRLKGEDVPLAEVCLVARTNNLVDQYRSALHEKGMETYQIRRSEAEDRKAPGVRLATMHRVKGLEFDRVIIAGVNDGVIPNKKPAEGSADPTVKTDLEQGERALLYVASTRARKEVLVTSFGNASPFLTVL